MAKNCGWADGVGQSPKPSWEGKGQSPLHVLNPSPEALYRLIAVHWSSVLLRVEPVRFVSCGQKDCKGLEQIQFFYCVQFATFIDSLI